MTTYTYRGLGVDILEPPRRTGRPPARCGTDGGYYRHRRITKTPACRECRCAHAAAERLAAARRRLGVAS